MKLNMATDKADIESSVDQYTDDLSSDVVDAVQSIESIVDHAADAAQPMKELAMDVYSAFYQLEAGNRALAAEAIMELFDSDSREAAEEAINIAMDVQNELQEVYKEIADVGATIDAAVDEVTDGDIRLEFPADLINL